MPSACTKPEKKASTEVETPIRQCLNVVEKKVRNLEKRKGKLDTYREKARVGTALNEDQKEAVGRYDSVVLNLEFARELQKQFVSIQSENEKLMKKQAKRESHERQQTEIRRIKELLSVQNLLDSMGAEDVRADFAGGSKGAVKLSEEELDRLDELYKLISPSRDEENDYTEQLTTASEHIVNFLEGRDKEVIGTTYKDLKAIVEKINDCGYFDAKAAAAEPTEEEEEPAAAEEETAEAAAQEPAAVEAKVEETPDYTLQQQLATESLPQQQPAAELDFAGDAAAASMLGQPQQSAPLQLDEPTTDATAPAAEDTFFSTQPFPQPRPFNEIVSSVTGTFDFLQDSQIEQAKNNSQQQQPMDPAVMAQIERGPPPAAAVTQQTKAAELSFVTDLHAAAASQYQTAQTTPTTATQDLSDAGQSAAGSLQFSSTGDLQPQSSSAASSSQPPAPSSAFDDDPSSMYNTISQGLQNSGSASQFESQQPSSGFGADSGADSGPPQPIPMPGQYNTDPDQSSAAAAAAGHDRNSSRSQFPNLNPNADIFQSMYTGGDQAQQQSGSGNFQQQSSGAAAAGADNRQQAPQQAWGSSAPGNDFQTQGYGGGQYGGRRGNQQPSSAAAGGGYRGQHRNGAGGPNNMNNGYRGGSNPRSAPGNQRGGNSRGSGGAYNSGAPGRNMQQQQGGPMRGPTGGNQGGAYKGYPPRNDYQPEGGYQGYNASSQGFMQSQQGGPRGGPRNSVPRTGRGGGGNYGNRMTPQ